MKKKIVVRKMKKRLELMKNSRIIHIMVCSVLAIFSVAAFEMQMIITETGPALKSNGWGTPQLLSTFAFSILYYWYYWTGKIERNRELKYWLTGLSAILAFLWLLGRSYASYNEWTLFLGGINFLRWTICMWIGLGVLMNVLLNVLANLFIKAAKFRETVNKFTRFIFDQHPVLGSCIVILLCQIPYLYAFFPGVISYDGAWQMGENVGCYDLLWHHPPFVTLLYGKVLKLSRMLGSNSSGIFVFVLLQSMLCAFAFAMIIYCLKLLKVPYWLRYLSLAYFSLFTVWPIYAITVIKDSLFYPLVILYVCFLVIAEKEPMLISRKKILYPVVFIIVMLMCLVRNNGLYLFLLSFPWLLFTKFWKKKVAGILLLICVMLAMNGIETKVWPAIGVGTGNLRVDLYSSLFQQTARYSIYHRDDVTEDEYEVLNQIFEYDSLAEVYDPEISDPVKAKLKETEGVKNITYLLKDYLQVWAQQGIKHPATYIQSFLNGCFGYFYPDRQEYKEGLGWYHQSGHMYELGKFDVYFSENTEEMRKSIEDFAYWLRDIPGIGSLYSCGFYTWILMINVVVLLALCKWRSIIPFIPSTVSILICMVSPVNSYIRYALPVFAVTPLLLGWTCYCLNEKEMLRVNKTTL